MKDFRQELYKNGYFRQEELCFADCDRYQRARVSGLLNKAAAYAGYDYNARGLTHDVLFEMGEVFLLSRMAMRIHRIPMAGDVLDIATYENGVKGAHMQRVYEMKDQTGGLRVSVKSDWILVNPATRKIMRPSAFTAKPIQTCDRVIDCPDPKKLLLPHEGVEELGTRQVVWSDLDGNGHLYSANYGDIIWDYLPCDLQERTPPGILHQLQPRGYLWRNAASGGLPERGRQLSHGGPRPGRRLLHRPVRVLIENLCYADKCFCQKCKLFLHFAAIPDIMLL